MPAPKENPFFQRTTWTDLHEAGIIVGVTALALSERCHPVVPPLLFAAAMVLERDPALVRSCFASAANRIARWTYLSDDSQNESPIKHSPQI